MTPYKLREDLKRAQTQLRWLSAFVDEAPAQLPTEFKFEVIAPAGHKWATYVRGRTPNDAIEELRRQLDTKYLHESNGLYKLELDGEIVDALEYRRL